jgi:hypothetical protein
MTDPGDGGADLSERRVWPLVVAALIVVGLLIGGGIVLAGGDPVAPASSNSASTSTSPSLPPVDQAQLGGSYRVTLVVRGARNLASLAGIDQPVPGKRRTATWRFFPTCSLDEAPCPVSWEGRRPRLELADAAWSGTIAGPPAPCLNGGRIEAPIQMHLTPQDGVIVDGRWFVRSFVGTSSVTFRCPGFAPSHGVVDVTAFRI